jgi:hypothetical protein
VRVAAVWQALDGDVDEGAAQDGQRLPSLEPAAVAVDLRMDVMPGLGPDSAVERGIGQDQGLVRLGGRGSGFFRPRLPCPSAAAARASGSRQWTSGPRRAGRPFLPGQVTASW